MMLRCDPDDGNNLETWFSGSRVTPDGLPAFGRWIQTRFGSVFLLSCSLSILPGPSWAMSAEHEAEAWAASPATEALVQPQGIIDDGRISSELATVAEAWLEEGKAVPMKVLVGQLSRRQCVLKLPRPSRRKYSDPKLLARCQPGTLVLAHLYMCTNCHKHHIRTSTGFVLTQSGAFVAAYHAVDSPEDATMVALTGDGRLVPVTEVLAASRKTDLAILQLGAGKYTPLPLAGEIPVGTRVRVLSHPDRDYYLLTEGLLSRYFAYRKGAMECTMMAVTADFAKGSSGAPVLDEHGAVVGVANNTRSIYYSVTDGKKDELQMVLKQCVPARYLLEMIRPE